MAQIVNVVITDDLDGSPDAETVAFSLGGTAYEIDLAPKNAERLRAGLQAFVEAARPAPGARPAPRARQARAARTAEARARLAAVRAWAAQQGLQVSDRGRIRAEIMRKYEEAH